MPQKVFEVTAPDGRTLEITGDTMPTGDQLRNIFAALPPAEPDPSSQGEPPSAPAMHPHTQGFEVAKGALKGAADSVLGMADMASSVLPVPARARNALTWARERLTPSNTPQAIGANLETAAEMMVPAAGAVKAAKWALPNAARAGRKFEQVMAAAGDLPVSITGPANVGLRIKELAARGGSLPKVVRNFMDRIDQAGAVSYREARDFASNLSRLSSKEAQRMSPVIKREVALMSKELNRAIAETAKQAGKLDEYQSAMREYARAAKMAEAVDAVKEGAKQALPWATAGGLGAWAMSKMRGR